MSRPKYEAKGCFAWALLFLYTAVIFGTGFLVGRFL
jgi:hypothetical protein